MANTASRVTTTAHVRTRQEHGRQLSAALAELRRTDPDVKLYGWDLARLAGVSPKTITRYNTGEAAKRRERGEARPQDLPAPAEHDPVTAELAGRFGLHTGGPPVPYWHPPAVAQWLAARQSPGNPRGGRPQPRTARRRRPGPKRRAAAGPDAP